mgnify:CR=1 FL=1
MRLALQRLDPLWEELFPAKQARIVQLLVDRGDVARSALTSGAGSRGWSIWSVSSRRSGGIVLHQVQVCVDAAPEANADERHYDLESTLGARLCPLSRPGQALVVAPAERAWWRMRDVSHADAVFADGSQCAGDEGAISLEALFGIGVVILADRIPVGSRVVVAARSGCR